MRQGEGAEEKPVPVWPAFAIAAATLALSYVSIALVASLFIPPEDETAAGAPVGAPAAEEEEAEAGSAPPEETEPPYIDAETVGRVILAGVAAGLAILLALYAAKRWREARAFRGGSEQRERLRQDLAQALRVSLEAILAEADCRRAIIACYARMEQSFATAGLPRREAETPLEFLARALADARLAGTGAAAAALRDLTRLYEVARFSEHPLHERERAEAVGAIRSLEGALEQARGEDAGRRTA
jgi:hypothetical protein